MVCDFQWKEMLAQSQIIHFRFLRLGHDAVMFHE
jgi:hypothetical protein